MDRIDWNHFDLSHIDWNAITHGGEIAAGGYIAYSALQWFLTAFVLPLIGMLISWRIAASYIKMRRRQAEAVLHQTPRLQVQPGKRVIEIEGYVSPLHDRVRRRTGK